RLWTMRQFAGFGSPRDTNRRFKFLLEKGQDGLSTAFDLPTLMGLDSDDPRSLGEVGRLGVAVDTLDDMNELFAGIDVGDVSVSMTINAPALVVMAFYLASAQERRLGGSHIRGAGSTAVQELAFTLADGFHYVEQCLARGMDVDDFAPRLSFF